jgi:hypothetical protein
MWRAFKIISDIDNPLGIKKILDHPDAKARGFAYANHLPEPRASRLWH